MNPLQSLLSDLSSRGSTATIFNQYSDPRLAGNLQLYLQLCKKTKREVLLVGEAPGHKGCAITGIPFTSCKVLKRKDISFFDPIRSSMYIKDESTESTATITWNALSQIKEVPMFWNAFPFHPHEVRNPKSNRAPSAEEVDEGLEYLRRIVTYLNPSTIAGLGWEGHDALSRLFPDKSILCIRHPSFGGKPNFIRGLNTVVCATARSNS